MYASDVEERTLTIAVSGKLWNRSLVMIDSQTGSLWSHLLGEAMEGPLKGEELAIIPSVITDWQTWQRDHPETTVLNMSRTAQRFQADFYRNPAQFVLGIADGGPRAWPLDQLKKQPVVNDEHDGAPLLIVFDAPSATAWSYDRRVGDRVLEFKMLKDGTLADEQTDSRWNFATGQAVAGPLKGQRLRPTLAIISYAKAWETFHPETTVWKAP